MSECTAGTWLFGLQPLHQTSYRACGALRYSIPRLLLLDVHSAVGLVQGKLASQLQAHVQHVDVGSLAYPCHMLTHVTDLRVLYA